MPPELLTFIGQAATGSAVSAICWYLLTEVRKGQRENSDATDRLTRTVLLLSLALNNIGPRAAEQAKSLLEEVTAAEMERAEKRRSHE